MTLESSTKNKSELCLGVGDTFITLAGLGNIWCLGIQGMLELCLLQCGIALSIHISIIYYTRLV